MEWADHIRAIRAEPEPAAPRLVCADWLLDRGDVRGEYIVIACRLHGLGPNAPDYHELSRRLGALERELGARWLEPIVALGAQGFRRGDAPRFARGFVEDVTLVGRAAAALDAICACEPVVELSVVSAGPRNFAAVARMPELAQLRSLTIRGDHVDGCELLLASPHLGGIRQLSLPNDSPKLFAALADGTARPHAFRLAGDLASVSRLATAGFFERLVDLTAMFWTDDTLAVLADVPLPALRALDLMDPTLGTRGVEALGARLGQLEQLELTSAKLDPSAIPLLIKYLSNGNLRVLSCAHFECDALADLIRSPAIAGVEELHLPYSFTDAIAAALRETPYLSRLRTLRIRVGDGDQPTGFELAGVAVDDYDEPT